MSDSIAGVQAAVYAGRAVSVFPSCALTPGLRELGVADGLPALTTLDIVLARKATGLTFAADHLARYIVENLGNMPV